MTPSGNPSACRMCVETFKPKSRRCRECNRYKDAHCEFVKCPLSGTGDARCDECPGPISVARSCTNCRYNGKGMPICWACPGPNKTYQTDGKTIVTLGSLEDPDGFIDDEGADRLSKMRHYDGDRMAEQMDGECREATDDGVTRLPPDVEKPLMMLLHVISSMSRSQLLVFHGMLNGMNLSVASEGVGFTKQYGSKILKELVKRFPSLRAFFSSCQGHGKRMAFDVE